MVVPGTSASVRMNEGPMSLHRDWIRMLALEDLFSQIDRKDMARAMYNRALLGFTAAQGLSSDRCRQLEDRLSALQVASAESDVVQNEFTEPRVAKSRSLKQRHGMI